MENIESGKIVLHRGREAKEVLAEETEEFLYAAQTPDPRARTRLVSEAAYYLAERRNFEPGHELEDWLEAEAALREERGWEY
jgi:hypothetical protein